MFLRPSNAEAQLRGALACPPVIRMPLSHKSLALEGAFASAPCQLQRLSNNNAIRWHSQYVNVGSVLRNEYLGLEPICDNIWAVYFCWKRIGSLDESKMKIVDTYGKIAHKKV